MDVQPSATFWLEFLNEHGLVVVHAYGEIDLSVSRVLESVLLQAVEGSDAATDVVVDVAGVTFCDSTLIRVLRQWGHHLRVCGRELRVVGAPDDVDRLFAIGRATADLPQWFRWSTEPLRLDLIQGDRPLESA